ncbi:MULTISPECIES: UdgX family uracil-DNA binding protein [unclassified Streptomyces]|uniref:UdgX family uracil-DNA binding protein n=1 Tax=unclassified Streptomyces TaxID=2593676 RepID=UPI00035EB3E5|nr:MULTISPECIES: UdgX family uracil-DNA binding protein [unclassified Streptomyces]MYT28591.1 UdgX family uracil-DNA binding protein [Streptomyces sp. SID8354]
MSGTEDTSAEPEEGLRYDATPYLPRRGGLPAHRRAAADCQGCPLFRNASQTVFGAGSTSARIMLVGEQPGDQEDRQGKPFVGPAGGLLHKALREAGLDEDQAYFTNAVKHFKFSAATRGKRRIHKPPSLREMTACRPWLAAELRLVAPEVVVALGSTAGRALLGPSFRVTKDRGVLIPLTQESASGGKAAPGTGADGQAYVVATLHPAAILRAEDREAPYAGLVSDLRVAVGALERDS